MGDSRRSSRRSKKKMVRSSRRNYLEVQKVEGLEDSADVSDATIEYLGGHKKKDRKASKDSRRSSRRSKKKMVRSSRRNYLEVQKVEGLDDSADVSDAQVEKIRSSKEV